MSRESMRSRINERLNNGDESEAARDSIMQTYTTLIQTHQEDLIISYISSVTGLDKQMVQGWLKKQKPYQHLNMGIVNKIVSTIKNFNPSNLSGILQRLVPPLAAKKN